MSHLAPVAVFAYARPDHLQRTLEHLSANAGFSDSPVTVFVDGPRNPQKSEAVASVIEIAKRKLGSDADIRTSAENLGLARSITRGVANLLKINGRVIVVEDDLETAPSFLCYMNAALDRYEADEKIFQVSGYMFNVPEFEKLDEAMVLPLMSTWGWATWERAWKHYDPSAAGWQRLRHDRELRRRFNLNGAYPYSRMIERQARGLTDSWGIRWYWSVFQAGGQGVFPPQSLVRNIGQDGSGTHGRGVLANFSGCGELHHRLMPRLPENLDVDPEKFSAFTAAIWRQNGGWPGWILNKLRSSVWR